LFNNKVYRRDAEDAEILMVCRSGFSRELPTFATKVAYGYLK
jgi:hypothetical protein